MDETRRPVAGSSSSDRGVQKTVADVNANSPPVSPVMNANTGQQWIIVKVPSWS